MKYTIEDFSVGDEVTVSDDAVDWREYEGVVLRIQEIIPDSVYPLRLARVYDDGRPLSTGPYLPVEPHEIEPLSISMEND